MLLQHGVKPYQDSLFEKKINGMILVNQQSACKYITKTGIPVYYKEEEVENYYFNSIVKIYSDKLSKFVFKCNENSDGAVIDRLSRIYSHIFLDEVQDLAGYDLEILKLFFGSRSNVLLVGDPRQVTYLTHNERKYTKYMDGKIKDFIQNECKKSKCDIDEETLNFSQRNNESICRMSSKLYPDYRACKSNQKVVTKHDGVFLVMKQDVEKYLEKYNPIQLRDSIKVVVNENHRAINFGESKGATFDRVLIYPTKPFIEWLRNHDSELKPISRSKFYVALTRAKFSVGIVFDFNQNTNFEDIENYIV